MRGELTPGSTCELGRRLTTSDAKLQAPYTPQLGGGGGGAHYVQLEIPFPRLCTYSIHKKSSGNVIILSSVSNGKAEWPMQLHNNKQDAVTDIDFISTRQ